jgi:hypothetical protein
LRSVFYFALKEVRTVFLLAFLLAWTVVQCQYIRNKG